MPAKQPMKLTVRQHLEHDQSFAEQLRAANHEIIEVIRSIDVCKNEDILPIIGLTMDEFKSFQEIDITKAERFCRSNIPLFHLHFRNEPVALSFIRDDPDGRIIERIVHWIEENITFDDKKDFDAFNARSYVKSRIRQANEAIIRLLDLFNVLIHPLSYSLFGIQGNVMAELARKKQTIQRVVQKGLPLFHVNPIWTEVDVSRKQPFAFINAKSMGHYLSGNAVPVPAPIIPTERGKDNERLLLAQELIRVGARSVFISNLLRMNAEQARDIYRTLTGQAPISGQTPRDHQWFIQTLDRRRDGAALLLSYAQNMMSLKASPYRSVLALLKTYKNYLRSGDEPIIELDRFTVLTTGWLHPRDIIMKKPSGFGRRNLKIMNCRLCGMAQLVEEVTNSFTCAECLR